MKRKLLRISTILAPVVGLLFLAAVAGGIHTDELQVNKLKGTRIHAIRMGTTAAMTAGTITVTDPLVTANTIIQLTGQNTGGTGGALRVSTRTPGTSWVITSSSGTDTGTVGWVAFEP
jgi:hypothetical protein